MGSHVTLRHVTPREHPLVGLLERLEWSETKLADEAKIDRPAMHKIIDRQMGLGKTRAQRIVDAAKRGGQDITVEELLAPSDSEIDLVLEEARAMVRKLETATDRLEQASARSTRSETRRSRSGSHGARPS